MRVIALLSTIVVVALSLGNKNMTGNDIHSLVDAALAKGATADATAKVIEAGDTAASELESRIGHASTDQLRGIIPLLEAISAPSSTMALLPLLTNKDEDIRNRAARAALSIILAHGPPAAPDFESKIRAGISENSSAAALLLGGFAPKALDVLKRQIGSNREVKLDNSGPVVPSGVVVAVSLSLLGNEEGRASLAKYIQSGDTSVLVFLLNVIKMIDDPSTLHLLADKTLNNLSLIAANAPAGAEPPRQLADQAVETFSKAMQLQVDFKFGGNRHYTQKQREKVQSLIDAAIPQ